MIRTIQEYSREHYDRKMIREIKHLRNGKFGIHNATLGTFVTKDSKPLEFSSEEKARKYMDKIMSKDHPGFLHVAQRIAKRQGISLLRAKAELAAGTRRDSAEAKRENPRLKKVKG